MSTTNFDIFQMAVRSSDAPHREEIEHEFAERYQRAIATWGRETAEALARCETLLVLQQLDLAFEGAAYLRSQLH